MPSWDLRIHSITQRELSEIATQDIMSRLIAANQQVNLTYPEGLPDGLLVRGVGNSLARALDGLGEPAGGLSGHVVLITDHDMEVKGPQFLLKGQPIEFACKPKQLWNVGTRVRL